MIDTVNNNNKQATNTPERNALTPAPSERHLWPQTPVVVSACYVRGPFDEASERKTTAALVIRSSPACWVLTACMSRTRTPVYFVQLLCVHDGRSWYSAHLTTRAPQHDIYHRRVPGILAV